MEKEEFDKKVEELDNELAQLKRQQRENRNKLYDLLDEFSKDITKKYETFMGKKVRITFKGERVRIGYLRGFGKCDDFDNRIYPKLSKVKKDGSESKNVYPWYDLEEWGKIDSIEETTDNE